MSVMTIIINRMCLLFFYMTKRLIILYKFYISLYEFIFKYLNTFLSVFRSVFKNETNGLRNALI